MNAIIINGETYELVEKTKGEDVCGTCDLHDMCRNAAFSLCVDIHNAGENDHYIKRPKEEKK